MLYTYTTQSILDVCWYVRLCTKPKIRKNIYIYFTTHRQLSLKINVYSHNTALVSEAEGATLTSEALIYIGLGESWTTCMDAQICPLPDI